MKKQLLNLILLIFCMSSFAQRKTLNFNSEGKFKIIQFTDVHYKQGLKESEVAIQLINEILDAEKPDLVVFTGDIIWAKPVKEGLDEVFEPVIDRKIPWVYLLGNHDDEFGMSRTELMEYAMQKPYCLSLLGDKNLYGAGNFTLEVKDSKTEKNGSILYFMDSGSYTPINGVGVYNWFSSDQVNWYRDQSAAYTRENDNKPYPSLAFFHIPLAEYPIMKAQNDSLVIGHKDETECNGQLNTGMFAAMRESGDVMGTFVGHDHDNDYIGEYFDIALAYGRYSGGKTVYNNLGLNGCRVIELQQNERKFSTYLRLLGGQKLYPVTFPDTFNALRKGTK